MTNVRNCKIRLIVISLFRRGGFFYLIRRCGVYLISLFYLRDVYVQLNLCEFNNLYSPQTNGGLKNLLGRWFRVLLCLTNTAADTANARASRNTTITTANTPSRLTPATGSTAAMSVWQYCAANTLERTVNLAVILSLIHI